jgi:hypothetical protein
MVIRSMLHRHSTLFGLLSTAAVAALAGYLTQWSVPVIVLAAIAGVEIFPRAFYGRAASRELDDAPGAQDSFSGQPLEPDYLVMRSAAHGEFNAAQHIRRVGPSAPTQLLSRRATVMLFTAAAALCVIVFGIEYAAQQIKLRTHPHHWYAVHLYISSAGSRYSPPRGVALTDVDGPYATRDACEQYLKTQSAAYFEAMACREMTDADAAAVRRP